MPFICKWKEWGESEYAFQGISFSVIRANANIINSSRIKGLTATKILSGWKSRAPSVGFLHSVEGGKKTQYDTDSRQRDNDSAECLCFLNQMWKLVKVSFLKMMGEKSSDILFPNFNMYLIVQDNPS